MPTPKKSKSGIFTLVVSFNYKRRNLTLGKIGSTQAKLFAANIEVLVSHRKQGGGSLPPSLTSWIQSLSKKHREQLGQIGLISRFDSTMTVRDLIDLFLEEYEAKPIDEIAASTKKQFRSSMENRIPDKLKDKTVIELEPKKESHRPNAEPTFSKSAIATFKDVESWQRNHFAKATWSRANGRIREIGVWAVKRGYCDFNPFVLLPKPGEDNEERNMFVEQEWIDDAMDMCLHPDVRLIFALGRYAGFRTPSEARTLKPKDIDFEKRQLHVFDSKKKRYRTMPLFDRIKSELELHQSKVEWGRFVLSDLTRSNTDANNYNLLKEAIARTQWELWPRLRQNLRASFENELLRSGFDERLVTLWVGHTIKTSRKHYQKLTDDDYLSAVNSTNS